MLIDRLIDVLVRQPSWKIETENKLEKIRLNLIISRAEFLCNPRNFSIDSAESRQRTPWVIEKSPAIVIAKYIVEKDPKDAYSGRHLEICVMM